MKAASAVLTLAGLLAAGTMARADTALVYVTPQSIKGSTFTLTSKPSRDNAVQFVIKRNVRGIDGPGTAAFVSHPETKGKGLGTPVKLERDGNTFTFRFSVGEDKVKDSVFTLWGHGIGGEGVTFDFRLGEFWKPDRR
jgi:hypothetical protein